MTSNTYLSFLLFSHHFTQQELTRAQMDDLLLSLLSDCKEKEGATEEEMGYIMARMKPETRGMDIISLNNVISLLIMIFTYFQDINVLLHVWVNRLVW